MVEAPEYLSCLCFPTTPAINRVRMYRWDKIGGIRYSEGVYGCIGEIRLGGYDIARGFNVRTDCLSWQMDSRDRILDEKLFYSMMLSSMVSTDFELPISIEVCVLFQESWQGREPTTEIMVYRCSLLVGLLVFSRSLLDIFLCYPHGLQHMADTRQTYILRFIGQADHSSMTDG